ncbi:MAG: 2-C-methyl-D-erythritol 4-phosphate cytidylyltransferase [Phycisphaeraceae bacterium]|nr:2-C-methyl-D-erythritol 4-phosphate cytidylyltransferase [Phycisphaeraceae bacterium]
MAGSMRLGVIIPAAGESRRFGGGSKLAQDLGGRPVLIRTVEMFARLDPVHTIVVGAPPEPEALEAFRERFGPTLAFHGASIVPGGRTARSETVRLALDALPDDLTHVAVHDAARPATSPQLLARILQAAEAFDAVVPGLPVADTIKRVESAVEVADDSGEDGLADAILGDAGRIRVPAHRVLETVPRDGLRAIQTPQVFRASLLRDALRRATTETLTDDASFIERLGLPVHVIDGEPGNIKITTEDDLVLVRAIMGAAPPAERPAHLRF